MAQKRLKNSSKICKYLQIFAKNARLFEEFCKNLQFFDIYFNPLYVTLAFKFVLPQLSFL